MMPVALPFSPLGRNPPVTNHISNGFGVDMDQMVYSANQEHVMYQQHRMYHRAPEHFSFNQTQMNQLCQVYGTNQMCQLYGTSFVGSFVHSNGQETSPMKGRLNGYRHYTDEMHGMPQVWVWTVLFVLFFFFLVCNKRNFLEADTLQTRLLSRSPATVTTIN